jgi:hypothetical protein
MQDNLHFGKTARPGVLSDTFRGPRYHLVRDGSRSAAPTLVSSLENVTMVTRQVAPAVNFKYDLAQRNIHRPVHSKSVRNSQMLELKVDSERGVVRISGMSRRARCAAASVSGWLGSSASSALPLSGRSDDTRVMVVALMALPIRCGGRPSLWVNCTVTSAFLVTFSYGQLLYVTRVLLQEPFRDVIVIRR